MSIIFLDLKSENCTLETVYIRNYTPDVSSPLRLEIDNEILNFELIL